ncbi:MAG: caspase family protein [Archangium sp.]|nr:caspase family protein [Archangium sp.]
MFALSLIVVASLGAASPVYALIVANNQSNDPKQAALKFADDDGARYFTVLKPMAQQVTLLTVLDEDTQRRFPGLAAKTRPPTRRELGEALGRINAAMKVDRAAGRTPVFFFVFTGHGQRGEAGEGSIALLGEQFTRSELFGQVLQPIQASTTHLIIDACDSYFFVNQRGSLPTAAPQAMAVAQFLEERSLDKFPDVGVVLSTSSQQESHEWAAINAGVFSHEVISALLGAADVNSDGKVEYSELRAFVAAANQQVDDPRGKVNMFARPPARDRSAPLADLTAPASNVYLLLPAGAEGRHWLEDSHGVRLADFNKEAERPLVLALPPGQTFFVRTATKEARVETGPAGRLIDVAQLAWAESGIAARGGSLDESFREHLFERSYGARFYGGFVSSSGELPVGPAPEPDLAP